MKNINELIGIIEGINFDGIINPKEIINLESWIRKNRNLVYNREESELVSLIDSILEDHIITEEEKNIMVQRCSQFLERRSGYDESIYELNGIIDGIICDGIVNEKEILRLQEWRKAHKKDICGHKPAEELYKVIDEILADGIITEKEQRRLLNSLSKQIRTAQFETKIEFLRGKVKKKQNIGVDILSILDDDNAMKEIHNRAENELLSTLNSYMCAYVADPEIVFISLVIIAMLNYDGNFYNGVRKIYKKVYEKYTSQKVEGLIRSILDRYRSEKEHKYQARTINVSLANTVAPLHFLPAFFDFIYDIYKWNFEYDLPDDLYEEFKFIYEGLQNSMMSNDDIFEIKLTKKTYKLIEATKQLIVNQRDLDAVINLSIIVVRIIDKHIWNKELKIYNSYLKKGYEKWSQLYDYDVVDVNQKRRIEWRSRWEPKFIIEGKDIYLVPPIHKVKAFHHSADIRICVYSGEKNIYENKKPDVREIIAGYKIICEKIRIKTPLNEINYKLISGGKVLYDSKDKLFRNFIVFSSKGTEIKNNIDYKGTAIICSQKEIEGFNHFYDSRDYILSSRSVKYGDYFVVNSEVFNFSSLIKPGVFGKKYLGYWLKEKGENEKIEVFETIKYLMFECSSQIERIEILINDKVYEFSDFHCTTTERKGIFKKVVDLHIKRPGIYKIVVNQYSDGKRKQVARFRFGLDPMLETRTEKLDDSNYTVSMRSSLIMKKYKSQIDIGKYVEDECVSLIWNGKEYTYIIPFDFDIYRITNKGWRPTSESLWIGEVTHDTKLDVYNTDVDELLVYSDKGHVLDAISLNNKDIYQEVGIGFLLSYKETNDYILLVFLKDGKVKKGIYCYNKCVLRSDTQMIFDTLDSSLEITTYYYGKGNVYFEIYDSNNNSVFKSEKLESGSIVTIENMRSYEKYNIVYFEKAKGLVLKKNREIERFERIFYARSDMLGKEFKLEDVYFYTNKCKIKKTMKKAYVHFLQNGKDGVYIAEIYMRGDKVGFRSNLIKPVEVEICSEVINGVIETIISWQGKYLHLDSMRNYVALPTKNKEAEAVSFSIRMS